MLGIKLGIFALGHGVRRFIFVLIAVLNHRLAEDQGEKRDRSEGLQRY